MTDLERLAVGLATTAADKLALNERFPIALGRVSAFACDEEKIAYIQVWEREQEIIAEISDIGASLRETLPKMAVAVDDEAAS